MNAQKLLKGLALAGSMICSTVVLAQQVDPNLPEYKAVSGISGNLTSIGSDTLNNLMTLWAEDFNGFYPNVNIQIQGAGTSTAPPALAEGTANFGPMSRIMRDSEVAQFEQAHGYPPTLVRVGIDTIAVFVNRDNPIEGLTLEEVDAIFSSTRRCGGASDITRWGQVGLTGAWANRDITLYSRNAVSGTYGYFRQHALCDGDFKNNMNEQPGSASVVQGITESINGIGYSGIGYNTAGVRAIKLGREKGKLFEPNSENAASGDYPLARFLYVYVNKHPVDGLEPHTREFLKMVLSRQGQEVNVRDGFIPLPASVAKREMERLGIK
ncbi:PstS family phosphate ABC transporter substrate-binding protein [Marinimicrobium sp. ABcell2]|uniref:PstS family phosphate ABC transporter substrate-binding protein n=1 Tax=Marinimicrobium sp. ABcell2 TaxID=3069751 RepID=UPI0027B6F40E|nr:phosphate ABC transporter substrate-binding protein PstS family protein [Marinimicrobium sp. ABcell2]MDQ2078250.1 phosphate ABC transporter substrate-binding protein PstS family protein [Marinimicrobium sp. ABcell2]